jgi:hypothetical protein
MRFLRPGVQIAEPYRITETGMMHVRRVVRVNSRDCMPAQILAHDQRGVAYCPGGKEKLLQLAFHALRSRRDVVAVRQHHRAHSGGAVVDRHAVIKRTDRIGLVLHLREGEPEQGGGNSAQRSEADEVLHGSVSGRLVWPMAMLRAAFGRIEQPPASIRWGTLLQS